MSAKTFEIYKPAAAIDGITTIIMEYVPLEKSGRDNFRDTFLP
jgi:hypothetical protein